MWLGTTNKHKEWEKQLKTATNSKWKKGLNDSICDGTSHIGRHMLQTELAIVSLNTLNEKNKTQLLQTSGTVHSLHAGNRIIVTKILVIFYYALNKSHRQQTTKYCIKHQGLVCTTVNCSIVLQQVNTQAVICFTQELKQLFLRSSDAVIVHNRAQPWIQIFPRCYKRNPSTLIKKGKHSWTRLMFC